MAEGRVRFDRRIAICGLIVAWDPAGPDAKRLAHALNDLHHRGPDAQASVWRDEHRLHLAHARLKIIDTSEGANQPFLSPCGRWALVFNGEIYNFRELRAEIGERWQWRTHGDTEALLAAWTLWGEACLDKLVGMFAFAIHDEQTQTLTLVRDRFGIKPLYQVRKGEGYVFASEIPPLLRFQASVAADQATIRTYLELGLYDHGTATFFLGIEALPPGALLALDLRTGQSSLRQWYCLSKQVEDLSHLAADELYARADELVSNAIRSHLVSDVAVGLNVSGGVDSSMLVRESLAGLGHAHLFTQDYAGYSELPWVRQVAEGGTLHVASLDADQIFAYLDSTVTSQAEPFGGVFVCGYNALYEAACKEDVTVLLDGNGVDECFLGYKRYHQIHVAAAASDRERASRTAEFEKFWGQTPAHVVAGASIDGTSGLCPEALASGLRQFALREMPTCADFGDAVRQAAAQDLLHSKIPRGLRFNDRVSMAHSRELRVPFLDHRLVEFAFGIPSERLLNENGTKTLFRDLLAKRTSSDVAYAPKRSVQSPQREWLACEWRPWVESILSSDSFAQRGWVDPDSAWNAYQAYCAGTQDNSFFVWQWLNLELWARRYLDGASG